jgi:ABC-type multidrug transport system fused ATPase/permease subunit
MSSLFDATPLSLVFVATVAVILLAVEIGFRTGMYRARKSEEERQAPIDGMVGSTLGLLAFVLAFTFAMATSRYDARKQLVLDDVIAIRTADLRAQLLPEQYRDEIRDLLREYVDVRVRGTLTPGELPRAMVRSEELQDQLWSRAAALVHEASAMPLASGLTQALVEMINLHSKRVTTAVHNRIPGTIWIALYCVTVLAMAITGYRTGVAGRRSMVATLTLVLAFSVVIVLIADLDRPQEGFLKVSQQAMIDLQTRLHRPWAR